MRKKIIIVLAFLIFIAVGAEENYMIDREINGESLKNNMTGDKTIRKIGLILPKSYLTDASKRYPVIYFLPGYGTSYSDFYTQFNMEAAIKEIRENNLKEMIVVIAGGDSSVSGTFYANSPVTGNWEDYISSDVVKFVDENYRTIADSASRGIAGHSMGGFGSLNIGMHHPEIFGVIYCLSPAIFTDVKGKMFDDEKEILAMIKKINGFNGITDAMAKKKMKYYLQNMGYGMAFAPSEEMPYFKYPYIEKDGKLIEDPEVMMLWENGAGGWKTKINTYSENLKKLRGIFIDFGIRDDNKFIPEGCLYLDELLKTANIDHKIEEYDGNHSDKLSERMGKSMFPFFEERLKFE